MTQNHYKFNEEKKEKKCAVNQAPFCFKSWLSVMCNKRLHFRATRMLTMTVK